MPKAKYRAARGSKAVAITYKYKIGGRKSSTSAHTLSSDELLEQYFSPKLKKDKVKIAAVLRLRNVEIVAPIEEETEAA